MSSFTQNEIKKSFTHLLEKKPFSSITVKDIVDECRINRGSFYYHYHDISELMHEVIDDWTEDLLGACSGCSGPWECIDKLIAVVQKEKKRAINIYFSLDRRSFCMHLKRICHYYVDFFIDTAFSNKQMTENELAAEKEMFEYLLLGFMVEWLDSGFDETLAKDFKQKLMTAASLQS